MSPRRDSALIYCAYCNSSPPMIKTIISIYSRVNKKSLQDDPIAQSIRRTMLEGRSELRLAGGDAESRLSCAVHLRRAFRQRRKTLGARRGHPWSKRKTKQKTASRVCVCLCVFFLYVYICVCMCMYTRSTMCVTGFADPFFFTSGCVPLYVHFVV